MCPVAWRPVRLTGRWWLSRGGHSGQDNEPEQYRGGRRVFRAADGTACFPGRAARRGSVGPRLGPSSRGEPDHDWEMAGWDTVPQDEERFLVVVSAVVDRAAVRGVITADRMAGLLERRSTWPPTRGCASPPTAPSPAPRPTTRSSFSTAGPPPPLRPAPAMTASPSLRGQPLLPGLAAPVAAGGLEDHIPNERGFPHPLLTCRGPSRQ